MEIIRTNSTNPDFIGLVRLLDAELAERDGADHAFYSQFNTIDTLKHTLVCYSQELAVGCGAIKAFGDTAMEVKRMYVHPDFRGRGIASAVLRELESWAAELGYTRCVLETGLRQPEAIALYLRSGYALIPNYGQYAGVENSRCYEKRLG